MVDTSLSELELFTWKLKFIIGNKYSPKFSWNGRLIFFTMKKRSAKLQSLNNQFVCQWFFKWNNFVWKKWAVQLTAQSHQSCSGRLCYVAEMFWRFHKINFYCLSRTFLNEIGFFSPFFLPVLAYSSEEYIKYYQYHWYPYLVFMTRYPPLLLYLQCKSQHWEKANNILLRNYKELGV